MFKYNAAVWLELGEIPGNVSIGRPSSKASMLVVNPEYGNVSSIIVADAIMLAYWSGDNRFKI